MGPQNRHLDGFAPFQIAPLQSILFFGTVTPLQICEPVESLMFHYEKGSKKIHAGALIEQREEIFHTVVSPTCLVGGAIQYKVRN